MARLAFRVEGAQRSFCHYTIERALRRLPGVTRVGFNNVNEEVVVSYDPRNAPRNPPRRIEKEQSRLRSATSRPTP